MNKAIIFDLDGTLIDTAQDLMAGGNAFFKHLGFKAILRKNQHEHIAICGGRAMIKFGLEVENKDITQEILDHYYPQLLEQYQKHLTNTSKPYPEVENTLGKLKKLGWTIGVCTNKPEYLAKELLDKLNLMKYFATIVGSDTFPYRKPNPKILLETIKLLNSDVVNSILIGDSKTDSDTAKAANVPFVMVEFGHGSLNHSPAALEPDAIVNSFSQIPDLAKQLISK